MASREAAAEPAAAQPPVDVGASRVLDAGAAAGDASAAAAVRATGTPNTAARWQKHLKRTAMQANFVGAYGKHVYSSAWDDINGMGRALDRLGAWLLPLLLVPPAFVALWILIPLDTGLQVVPAIRSPWLYMAAIEPLYWPWKLLPIFLIAGWFFRLGLKHLLLAELVFMAAILLGYEPLAWTRRWIEKDFARPLLILTLFAAAFVFLALFFYFRFVRFRDSTLSLPSAILKKALLLCLWGLSITLFWGSAFAFARILYPRLVPASFFYEVQIGKTIPPAVLLAADDGRVTSVSDEATKVTSDQLAAGWYHVHPAHEGPYAVMIALLSFRFLFGPVLANVTRQVVKVVAPQAEDWLFSECYLANEFAVGTLEGFYYASLFTSIKSWSSLLPAFASILAAQCFVALNASKTLFRIKHLAIWAVLTGWGRWSWCGEDPHHRPQAPDIRHALFKTGKRLSLPVLADLEAPAGAAPPAPAASAGPAVVARAPFLAPDDPRSDGPEAASADERTEPGAASAGEDPEASAGEGHAAGGAVLQHPHEPIFGTEERRRILGLDADQGSRHGDLPPAEAAALALENEEYVMWLEEFSMVFAIRAVLDPLTQALFLLFVFLVRDVERHNIVFYPKFVTLADSSFVMLVKFSFASLGFRFVSSVFVWFVVLRMKGINMLNKGLSLLRGNGVLFLVLFFTFVVLLQDVWISFAELVFDVSPADGVAVRRVPPTEDLIPWQDALGASGPGPTPHPALF